jgi:hypothetical protein
MGAAAGGSDVRIGIVGGAGRAEPLFADLVLLLTDVSSHGAVRHARQVLRERGRSPVLLRRCGSARFASLLAALDERARSAGANAS